MRTSIGTREAMAVRRVLETGPGFLHSPGP